MTGAEIVLEREAYEPGETLIGAVFLGPEFTMVDSVEVRVGWRTEGKGDTDRGEIHREELVVPSDEASAQEQHVAFQVPLLMAPLSYDGPIVKIRWAVEARVRSRNEDSPRWLQFLERLLPGNVVTKTFRLGKVHSPRELKK
jgi:hypothetical protein